ncbi:MAG: YdcH family protein [Bdellovibrionota bacterium]|jgi:uncharacterized protein YdcH (DUF465 family)
MNTSDRLELAHYAQNNQRLQRLMKKHEAYEEQLRILSKKMGVTSSDQQRINTLKRKKLQGKDEMVRILQSLRDAPNIDLPSEDKPLCG